jgi:hypothetical protein
MNKEEYWKIRDLKELIKIHEKDEPSSITRDYIQDLRIKISLLEEGIQEGRAEREREIIEIMDCFRNPYPKDIFLPILKEEYTAIHILLLKHFGVTLDRVSADLMRRARGIFKEELISKIKEKNEKN